MTSVKYGLLLAAIVAVPVFWPLLDSGEMTTDAAIRQGGIVVAGCVFGVYLLTHLVNSYSRQQAQARRRAAMTNQLEQAVQRRQAANESGGHPNGT
jgi:type VI protein secretion system component VasK